MNTNIYNDDNSNWYWMEDYEWEEDEGGGCGIHEFMKSEKKK